MLHAAYTTLKLLSMGHMAHSLFKTKNFNSMDLGATNPTGVTPPSGAAQPATPPSGGSAPTTDTTNVVVVTPPPGVTSEPGGISVHPMSCEARHLIVGSIVGLVIGLFIGYFEMWRKSKGGEYIAGFGVGGLLLGLAVGFALPCRKRNVVQCADGRKEVFYTE